MTNRLSNSDRVNNLGPLCLEHNILFDNCLVQLIVSGGRDGNGAICEREPSVVDTIFTAFIKTQVLKDLFSQFARYNFFS